jgi:hypothetical protein
MSAEYHFFRGTPQPTASEVLKEGRSEKDKDKSHTKRNSLTVHITACGLTGLALLAVNVIKTGNIF